MPVFFVVQTSVVNQMYEMFAEDYWDPTPGEGYYSSGAWNAEWDGGEQYILEINDLNLPVGFNPTSMSLTFTDITTASVTLQNSTPTVLYSNSIYNSDDIVSISVGGDLQTITIISSNPFTVTSIKFNEALLEPPTWYSQFAGWDNGGDGPGTWNTSGWDADFISGIYKIELDNLSTPGDYRNLFFRCNLGSVSSPVNLTIMQGPTVLYDDTNYTDNKTVNFTADPTIGGVTIILESNEFFTLDDTQYYPDFEVMPV